MTKYSFILLILLINILRVYTFVIPTSNTHKHTKTQVMVKLTSTSLSPKLPSPPPTQKNKMKSNNIRWVVHGILTELFYNVFVRTITRTRTRMFASKEERLVLGNNIRNRLPPKHEVAIVTGATGGIGSQIATDLAYKGYDVVIAARNMKMGEELVEKIQDELKQVSTKEDELPTIRFVEYHADDPQSAISMASSIKDMKSPLTVLINNAGIMGKSKQMSMRVNVLGPVWLTFALLPQMITKGTVINVGSSAHLRATSVIDEDLIPSESSGEKGKQSYIDTLPGVADDDLSTYAASKLALMQFSTLLRQWLTKSNDKSIKVIDAHPGLVWTPLLRNHIGDKAVNTLTKTGLANLIYKSSSEGAAAIVSALSYSAPVTNEQVYFINGKPGGYSASESLSLEASNHLWNIVLKSEVDGVIELPKGWEIEK